MGRTEGIKVYLLLKRYYWNITLSLYGWTAYINQEQQHSCCKAVVWLTTFGLDWN